VPDTRERILIVDDKECIRTSMSLVLTEMGHRVRSAVDGFSALREIRQEVPDILLSDLNMPGMSGFELLLVVRRRFPAIQVVAMSGAFSGKEVPSGIPADAFYQKGSSMTALLHICRTLPQMNRRAPAPPRTGSPLWIQRNGNDSSGKAYVTVTCPECLRTSPQAIEGTVPLIREMNCIHCGSSIQYAVVEPSDRMPPQAFRRAASAAIAAQCAPTLSN
jgi:CheY-like chemotaxis protein